METIFVLVACNARSRRKVLRNSGNFTEPNLLAVVLDGWVPVTAPAVRKFSVGAMAVLRGTVGAAAKSLRKRAVGTGRASPFAALLTVAR